MGRSRQAIYNDVLPAPTTVLSSRPVIRSHPGIAISKERLQRQVMLNLKPFSQLQRERIAGLARIALGEPHPEHKTSIAPSCAVFVRLTAPRIKESVKLR